MTAGRRPYGLYIYAAVVYAFLFLPIIWVAANSFNKDPLGLSWYGATLHWYRLAWGNSQIVAAAETSLKIAVVVTVLSVVFGTSAALALRHSARWVRGMIRGSSYARLVIPELVLALALLIIFTRLKVALGFWTVVLGHVVFNSAYVTVIVAARLAVLDSATEEAARDLGATAFRAFRRVTVPEIMPALIAGALLAFTFSLDDVVTSFFLAGTTSTLPLLILSLIRFEVSPVVNALGTTLMVVNGLCMAAFLVVNWRRGVGAHSRMIAASTENSR